ncbi:MAG: hypothetical protein KAT06_01010 [Gammaproteobacteria bacterium]|nr:hypothetical protein [Gammaproteobacteria bacterium]
MKNWRENILSNKAIYILLIFALLITQTIKLHMHIEHENAPLIDSKIHTVDIHAATYLHEINHDLQHHHDGAQIHHSSIDVDSAANNIVKKNQILDSFVFFILILFIILSVPQLRQIRRCYEEKKPRAFSYCFPPQRAPPTF